MNSLLENHKEEENRKFCLWDVRFVDGAGVKADRATRLAVGV